MNQDEALVIPVASIAPMLHDLVESRVRVMSEGRSPIGFGRLVARMSEDAGIRADVAIGVAMHETGRFKYGGTDSVFSADPTYHNFGGIKTTDSSATARFPTDARGVAALVAHLAWYCHTEHVIYFCSLSYDPRHFAWGHRGQLQQVRNFGLGTWNTSPLYGQRIANYMVEFWS